MTNSWARLLKYLQNPVACLFFFYSKQAVILVCNKVYLNVIIVLNESILSTKDLVNIFYQK
jgi:hypothetical protein